MFSDTSYSHLSFVHRINGIEELPSIIQKFLKIEVNLDEVEVVQQEDHNSKIQLTDNIGMVMGYPKTEVIDMIAEANSYEDGLKLIAGCVDMVWDGDTINEKDSFTREEMLTFLESLTKDQFTEVERFFETMPRVKHEMSYTCEGCEDEVRVILEGIDDFFG